MHEIIRYPRTAHIAGSKLQIGDTAEGQVRIETLTDGLLVFEEKLDGSNCGISFNNDLDLILQSRGHMLLGGPREGQFDLFKAWTARHHDALFDILGTRYIMYGEWLYARHTIFYDRLQHFFYEFDIFDQENGIFLDTEARIKLLDGSPVISVPVVHRGPIKTSRELYKLTKPSLYKSDDWMNSLVKAAELCGVDPDAALRETDASDLAEGLYIKHEMNGKVIGRYKFVRADFIQTILNSGSHWHDRTIIPNQLAPNMEIF